MHSVIKVKFGWRGGHSLKSYIFWDITPCSPLKINRRFGRIYRLHFQCRMNHVKNQHEAGSKQSSVSFFLHAGSLFGLLFDPKDGGDMYLRNVGWYSTDYTALYSRRFLSWRLLFCILTYILARDTYLTSQRVNIQHFYKPMTILQYGVYATWTSA
jgi:hypothetical protein